MFTQPFHDFHTHNAFLSEGGVLAVVVGDFTETPHQTRDNKDFPRRLRQALRGCAPRVPPSPVAAARRTRGEKVVRATPAFSPLVRHEEGQRWRPIAPRAGRSLSPP